ncbi:MAG: ABC transporter ATP-binding protein [Mycobacteriales bacterium]
MDTTTAVDRVTLRKGDATLLREVSLTVRPGERWALLGPNGCGKTTLLSLLGALQHPTTGSVTVLGRRLGQVDLQGELWPRLGHVQGRHAPSGRLTAGEVVLTGLTGTNGLRLRWQPTPGQRDAAAAALAELGVDRLADHLWTTLSNGEQRRVLLARALVRAPDLLLLDEPAAGLDLPSREHLVDALDRLAADRPAVPWVLVTHHVEELPVATTHVALMRSGRLLAAGPAAEVLDGPSLSACFDLPLAVEAADGRWWARRTGTGQAPVRSSRLADSAVTRP